MAAIMGFDRAEVEHIKLAERAGLGVAALGGISVLGRRICEVERPFRRPSVDFSAYGGSRVIESGAFSGCPQAVHALVMLLEREKRLDQLDAYTILCGQTAQLAPEELRGRDLLLMGTCTRAFSGQGLFIPRCAPQRPPAVRKLADRYRARFAE